MDIRKIKKLIDLIDETGVNELEVEEGDARVKVVRYAQGQAPVVTHALVETTPVAAPAAVPHQPKENFAEIKSPMVGTFYASSSPEVAPFVKIGQKVKVGDTLCIVEAMKMFNHIEATVAGVVRERLVDDGQPIEYGQVLFLIET